METNRLTKFTEKFFSHFTAPYRKHHSSNHVLLRLTEEWKKSLDNKKIIGASIMDFSKAFDCIPLNVLVAQLHAYDLTIDAVIFVYSYLKRQK